MTLASFLFNEPNIASAHRQILLNQTEIRLYLPLSDWLGTKRTSVWFQINRKMVNTSWFNKVLKRFLCVEWKGGEHLIIRVYFYQDEQNVISMTYSFPNSTRYQEIESNFCEVYKKDNKTRFQENKSNFCAVEK